MNKLLIAGLIGVVSLFFTADVVAQERGRREHRGQEHSEKAPIHKGKKHSDKRGAAKCGVDKCKCTCHKKSKRTPKKNAGRNRAKAAAARIWEDVKSGKITREDAVKRLTQMRERMGRISGEGERGRRGSRGRRGNSYRSMDAAPLWKKHLENLKKEEKKTLPFRRRGPAIASRRS